jgi:Domain of unknown function (DUF4350)
VRAALLLLAASAAQAADYDLSANWNGLSVLIGEAQQAGCEVSAPGLLDWSVIGPSDVLFLVYPEVVVDGGRLKRFLAQGGHALVADDFGAASDALASLEIRRSRGSIPPEVPRFRNHAFMPIAHPMQATELGRATDELVANHPARFESGLPATYGFADGIALVIEGQVGTGYFVALSDPSVLINNMLELESNRAFAQGLVRRLCRPGDRVLLFSHGFTVRGEPPESGSTIARVNAALGGMNEALHDDVAAGRTLWVAGALLAVAALFLFGASFPARGSVDLQWTRLSGILTRDDGGMLGPAGLPWDYSLPAGVVRDEAVDRLNAALGVSTERMGPSELGRRVEAQLGVETGRRAADLWRDLHRLGWKPGERPVEAISARRFRHMHELATALFDELAMRQNQGT